MGELPHVLLVDGDRLVAEMYRFGLEQAGLRVTVVGDAQALADAIDDSVGAVVIEWELLDVAGDELLRRLATNVRVAGRPVFVLTNFISPLNDKTRTVSRELGATEWLVKSATAPDMLAAAILFALGQRRTPEPSGSG